MRKAHFIDLISKQTGIVQNDVAVVLEAALEGIRAQLIQGNHVRFQRFGIFKLRKRPSKVARNLKGKSKNPEPIILKECLVPQFKPSKQFLKR